jgi:CDP-glycerol glycerophosphotransferase (TagB/SpsB family)
MYWQTLPHPQSFILEKELVDRLMAKYSDIEWNRDTDNFDALNRSDILILDFSGVVFDFALVLNKPVIYTLLLINYPAMYGGHMICSGHSMLRRGSRACLRKQ